MTAAILTLFTSEEALSTVPRIFITTQDQSPIGGETGTDNTVMTSFIVKAANSPQILFQTTNTANTAKRRGSSSNEPGVLKFQYNTEFDDKHIILGFPNHDDFILQAVRFDSSFIRNVLVYELYRQMGRWAARTMYVELYINGEYRGLYIWQESVKKDTQRVNIATNNATSAVDVGYIFESRAHYDDSYRDFNENFWISLIHPTTDIAEFKYAKASNTTPAHLTFGRALLDAAAAALDDANFDDPINGWRAHLDEPSFVDMALILDFARPQDAFGESMYMFRTTGGKLIAGPPWDMDHAFGAAFTALAQSTTGHLLDVTPVPAGKMTWYYRLFEDDGFKLSLKTRFLALRASTFSNANVIGLIDSYAALINSGPTEREEAKWNTFTAPYLGIHVAYGTNQAEINVIKTWVLARLTGMDTYYNSL